MRSRVENMPGVKFNFSQVIQTRNDELISGINAQIAVKVFGEDQDQLRKLADNIRDAMSHIRGVEDLAVEQVAGEEHLEVDVERDQIARYGLNIADVLEVTKIAIGGDEATDVLEGQRRFAIFVRLKEDYRNQVDKLADILVNAPVGGRIPLGQLATFKLSSGDSVIDRENSLRRVVVMCNVKGRDIGSFVRDAQQAVAVRPAAAVAALVEERRQLEFAWNQRVFRRERRRDRIRKQDSDHGDEAGHEAERIDDEAAEPPRVIEPLLGQRARERWHERSRHGTFGKQIAQQIGNSERDVEGVHRRARPEHRREHGFTSDAEEPAGHRRDADEAR